MGQTIMDTGSTENSAEVNVTRKRKKKRKSMTKINVEVQREVDTGSVENLAEGNVTIEKPKNTEDVQNIGHTNMGIRLKENLAKGNLIIKNPKIQDDVQSMDQSEMSTGPKQNSAEVHLTRKRKKKLRRKKKIDIEVQREVYTGSTENLAEENLMIIKNPEIQDDVQSTDQNEMDTGPKRSSAEGIATGKRKKKRKGRVKVKDETQSNIGTSSTENLAQGNAVNEIPKIKDEVQSTGMARMDTGSKENLAEGNVTIKNLKIQDEVQNKDQTKMDMRPAENFAKGNLTGKRKKKRNRVAKFEAEVPTEIVTRSTENLAQANMTIEKPNIEDEIQHVGQTKVDTWSTENLAEGNVIIKDLKIQDEAQSMDQNKMDTWKTEKSTKGDVSGKRKKKRKTKDEVQSNFDTRPVRNLAEGYLTTEKPKTTTDAWSTKLLAEGNVTIENKKIQDEALNMDQTKMETGPAENSAEKTGKRKKKRKRKREINDEVSVVDTRPTENLAVGNVITKKPKINDEVQSIGLTTMDTESTEKPAEGIEVHSRDQTEMDTGPTETSAEGNVNKNRKRKRKQNRTKKAKLKDEASRKIDTGSVENLPEGNAAVKLGGDCISNGEALAGPMEFEGKLGPSESQEICHPHLLVGQNEKPENGLSELCNELILDKEKGYAEGTSSISTSNVRVTMDSSSYNVKDPMDICPSPIIPVRRKLLVLDVNGLLADIVYAAPNHCRGDVKIFGRAVFKRPFCDDFLKFCFQNFDVGIWSSRSKKIIEPVVNYLLGDQKDKLLFCWDMDHATKTRFNTLENKHKPLVCKELSKIWESDDCNLRWKRGDYDKTNTLLLDDSPYKALLNPLHTAIFPSPYQYDNENDDSLGPGGNLRVYLEGLVTAENVHKYVEQHPFGQGPITEEHSSWEFYSRVLHQVSKAVEGESSMPNPVEGKSSLRSPVEGKTSMPISVEGKTSMLNPEEGKTSMPVEGITSITNPGEGKTSMPSPVEGKSKMPNSLKSKDVKGVKAQQASPFKPKKEKATATFLWPI